MRLIIDASVAITWAATSQITSDCEAAASCVGKYGALVPAHFHLELVNALWQLERRKRLTSEVVDDFLADMTELAIEVDLTAIEAPGDLILTLARTHALTTYDAAYLELALRTDTPLATRDAALARAARQSGARLFSAE